ncbi:MAG: FecR domain-containing protein [Oscillospiraceae bacterium]
MGRVREFLEEHLRTILIALISLILLILAVVVFSVIVSENKGRVLYISEVAGGASIIKGDGQIAASRNMTLQSGDIIVTDSEGAVKLKTDNGKYIYVQPSSTVYVNFTEKRERGSIVINISDGSVLCRLDNKLKSGSVFEVRTPNSVISAMGTVFYVDFSFHDSYNGYNNVMLTKVYSVESMLTLQLYNNSGERSGDPQLLGEALCAELMSCGGFNGYNCLNQEYPLTELSSSALRNLIRIRGERSLPVSLTELNNAFNAVYDRVPEETEPLISAPPVTTSEEYIITSAPPFGEIPENSDSDRTVITSPAETTVSTEISSDTSAGVQTASSDISTVYVPPVTTAPQTDGSATDTSAPSETSREITSASLNWWEMINTENTETAAETTVTE